MMREINETEEEANHATYINNFGEIYSVRDLLGVGAFGVVLLVKNRQTDEKSALKIINKDTLSIRALNILKNESKIIRVRARKMPQTPTQRPKCKGGGGRPYDVFS
mgnify:CR=1 FL=1